MIKGEPDWFFEESIKLLRKIDRKRLLNKFKKLIK